MKNYLKYAFMTWFNYLFCSNITGNNWIWEYNRIGFMWLNLVVAIIYTILLLVSFYMWMYSTDIVVSDRIVD
jgi:hypothetical protein